MNSLSWKPVLRDGGRIYCAPACGRGCTIAEYNQAVRASNALAKRMGPGWTTRVSENLGWHWSVFSPCGRISLSHYPQQTVEYSAMLGESFSGTGRWSEIGRTPEAAMRKVIRVARADLMRIGATIGGF